VFSYTVANYSSDSGYIWNELPVLVTFVSDWQQASTLLQEIANEHATHLGQDAAARLQNAMPRFVIVYSVLTPTV
jgi:small-conductance mechanosensitive channel